MNSWFFVSVQSLKLKGNHAEIVSFIEIDN